ncbi:MAG: aminomethyltransferase [marine bacterium B5-7]|nr:MAG: aminomethyltransferase [marine bacterium B5-7]
MSTAELKRTPLYSLHIEQNAQMVPFAGYEMPVQYSNGLKQEHLHTREHAGLFDISHMGQVKLSGESAIQFLESLVPSRIQDLSQNAQRYTVFTNEHGGIIDDLMITNADDYFFIVINAACKDNDIKIMQRQLPDDCILEELTEFALLALQGPKASAVMQRFCPAATELVFMSGDEFTINDVPCFINRCGYTGEDGFEISIPAKHAEDLARNLLAENEVALIGLGARDSLRLDAGYCLYGHDLDVNTSPLEANLNWVISKSRLEDESHSYPGIETIRHQSQQGVERLRIGLLSDGKAPIREGVAILNEQEEIIGNISSGGYSPTVEKPVAIGYVNKQYASVGTQLIVKVRNRIQQVKVVTLPFVEHRYYKRRT